MRGTTLMLLGTSIFIGSPSHASDAYPVREVFSDVQVLCSSLTSLDETTARANANGWRPFVAPKKSPFRKRISDLVAMSKEGGARIRSLTFSKVSAGETLHAFLYEEQTKETFGVGCQIYDIDEDRRPARADIESLMGRPADRNDALTSETLMLTWRRNGPLGNQKFVYAFIPADGYEVVLSGLAGIRISTETTKNLR